MGPTNKVPAFSTAQTAAAAVCGLLGQAAGMGIFPAYLLAFYLVMLAVTQKARRLLKR